MSSDCSLTRTPLVAGLTRRGCQHTRRLLRHQIILGVTYLMPVMAKKETLLPVPPGGSSGDDGSGASGTGTSI